MSARLSGRTETRRRIRVLFVGDQTPVQPGLRRHLAFHDFAVSSVSPGREAIEAAKGGEFDVVLLELPFLTEPGEEILEALKREWPAAEIIVLTDQPSLTSALRCAHSGCFCYVEAPCDEDELIELVLGAYRNSAARRPRRPRPSASRG